MVFLAGMKPINNSLTFFFSYPKINKWASSFFASALYPESSKLLTLAVLPLPPADLKYIFTSLSFFIGATSKLQGQKCELQDS